MKYIFVAGAPGSKWSSVVKNIYLSPSIDSSDASPQREYWHDATGEYQLMHMGVYYGPGMEFGHNFDRLDQFTKEENEAEFDKPFSGVGTRVIKSHVFSYHIDYIKKTWPDCPIILVDRADDSCLGWWVKCGEFNITYPSYKEYYKNLRQMAHYIRKENKCIRKAVREYPNTLVKTNLQLARVLKVDIPPSQYYKYFSAADTRVYVI